MINSLEKNIKIEQFYYFLNSGYKFYNIKKINFLPNLRNNQTFIYGSKSDSPQIKNHEIINKIVSLDDFLLIMNNHPIIIDNEKDIKKFFIKFLVDHPNLQQNIIKQNKNFIYNFKIENYYKDFLNINFNKIQDLINFLNHNFNQSIWSVDSINLNLIQQVILKKWSIEESFKFWLSFFRKRKNQINNPKKSKFILQFLEENFGYDREKLIKFSRYFKYLKKKFSSQEIYFFESEPIFKLIFNINLKKTLNSFLLDDFTEEDYFSHLNILSKKIQHEFSFLDSEVRKNRSIVSISFESEKTTFNHTTIQNIIIHYFSFLEEAKCQPNNFNYIKQIITHYYLKNETPSNTQTTKQNSIFKI